MKTMKFRDLVVGQAFTFIDGIPEVRYVCQIGKTEMYCPKINQNTIGHSKEGGEEVFLKSDREVLLLDENVRHFDSPIGGRVESGPIQFGGDWKGLFLRGDNCAALRMELEELVEGKPAIMFGMTHSVIEMIGEVLSRFQKLKGESDEEFIKRLRFNDRKVVLMRMGFYYDEFGFVFVLPNIWSCYWEQVYHFDDKEWESHLAAIRKTIERHAKNNNKL